MFTTRNEHDMNYSTHENMLLLLKKCVLLVRVDSKRKTSKAFAFLISN